MRKLLAPLLAAVILAACGTTTHHQTVRLHAGPAACPGYQTAYGCQAHSPSFGLPPAGPPKLTAPSSVPTMEMRDAVTPSAIPAGTRAIAGYLNGNFQSFRPLVARFPRAYHVPITVQAFPIYPSTVSRMVCLDVEPQDATPSEAGPWARGEIRLGLKPCIYSALRNGMAGSEQSLAASLGHGWRSKVFLWDADWTGSPRLDAGFDATQWLNHGPHGENYDQSIATLAFLGVHPKPLLPVCIHHRMTRFQCNGLKEKIASARRAESASNGAYDARDCHLFAQRVSWFSTRLREHPKIRAASRHRALAASRTAYRQRSCAVYAHRAAYFLAVIGRTEAVS